MLLFPNDAEYFVSHPGLSHITFIGSKNVAHHVVSQAAKQLTPCVVELGGKDALIVLDDVKDVQSLSSVILRGTFKVLVKTVLVSKGLFAYRKCMNNWWRFSRRESSHLELDRILTNWMK